MAKELSRDFGCPKAQVWNALPAALQSVKMSVDSSDPASGRIEASGLGQAQEEHQLRVRLTRSGARILTVE